MLLRLTVNSCSNVTTLMRNHNAQHSNGQKQEEQPTANSQQPPATLGAKTTSNALVGGWPGWPVRLPATGRAVMYL